MEYTCVCIYIHILYINIHIHKEIRDANHHNHTKAHSSGWCTHANDWKHKYNGWMRRQTANRSPVPDLRSNKPCWERLWIRWVVAVWAATFGDKCLIISTETAVWQHGGTRAKKNACNMKQYTIKNTISKSDNVATFQIIMIHLYANTT